MAPEQSFQPDVATALCQICGRFGRAICREPQKLEAMLRDLCPESRREVFLLVAALRERILPELMAADITLPEMVVVSRSCRKLVENLCLNEDAAAWAVESWLRAARILATVPDVPLPAYVPLAPMDEARSKREGAVSPIDALWIVYCVAAITLSLLVIWLVAWFSFHHRSPNVRAWLGQSGFFFAGLTASALGLFSISRALNGRPAPGHWARNTNLGTVTVLSEVATVLSLPVVPVVTVALWVGEWSQSWHLAGEVHDLAFHLGRVLQSVFVAAFLWAWCISMVRIHGRLGYSMVGRRK
jgi:hypothetical protein